MRIIEKVAAAWKDGKTCVSFEFLPFKNKEQEDLLMENLEHTVVHQPTFCDITWRFTSFETSLDIANTMQNQFGLETMMHLTCFGCTKSEIDHALDYCKQHNVENILALRGDVKQGSEFPEGLSSALDLVKHIRTNHDSHFGIVVAGYPEGHGKPGEKDYSKDLLHLKQKVDAGADFVISQMFFDTEGFLKFVEDCRGVGINCPIVPGIQPILDYRKLRYMADKLCFVKIPQEIELVLKGIQNNPEAVKNYGIQLCTEMCTKLMERGVRALHFYTQNSVQTPLRVLENLGMAWISNVPLPLPAAKDEPENGEEEPEKPSD